jgi:spore germination cell wall hydrolase CwlJ-like protein
MALLNRTTPLLNASPKRAVPTDSSKTSSLADSTTSDVRLSVDRVARFRPTTAAALFGVVLGLVIGGSYLGGQAAQATTLRVQAERLDSATSAGFTEEALAAAAGGLDASALSIARRHDPYTVAGSAQRDRQAELLTARLESLRTPLATSGLRQINLTQANLPASERGAQPFRLANAMDASRELDCLTQAAYYEARGEGREGMQAVVQVVLNRVRHTAFPMSVCGVVYQGAGRRTGCQFSFTCNGAMRGTVNRTAWNKARDVASGALSGAVFAPVGNATHFHTTAVAPVWRHTLIRVGQVGEHLFYRFGGRAGSRDAFVYQPSPSAPTDGQPEMVQASLQANVPTSPEVTVTSQVDTSAASAGATGLIPARAESSTDTSTLKTADLRTSSSVGPSSRQVSSQPAGAIGPVAGPTQASQQH